MLMLNDDAASYTFVMIVVLIFVAAVVYAFMIPGINAISRSFNTEIDQGHISTQTVTVYNWNKTFFYYSIGIGLIGFVIFGIVRAIEVAEAGQGGW